MVPHLKYASDEDLKQIGLSRPEIRRLRKFYEKYFPHGYLSKIKRLLQHPVTTKRDEAGVSSTHTHTAQNRDVKMENIDDETDLLHSNDH